MTATCWRPITAIRGGDADGNRRTEGNEDWTPMLPTPPYPEHPSGFNCVTSGFMFGGAAFFGGQHMEFSVVKRVAGQPDVVREYERFRDVLADAVEASGLQGIHFRAADAQAARAGQQVAAWVKSHYFRPVHYSTERGGSSKKPARPVPGAAVRASRVTDVVQSIVGLPTGRA